VAAFVSFAVFEAALQRGSLNGPAALEALEEAADLIRDRTCQSWDLVVDDEVSVHGTGRQVLLLPHVPVNSVSVVVEDGTTLAPADYVLEPADGILWRVGAVWPMGILNITVTNTHGYATPPAWLRMANITIAKRLYDGTPRVAGIRSEQLGAHSVVTGDIRTEGGGELTDVEGAVLDRHRFPRIPVA
jgi:hypothetical protein